MSFDPNQPFEIEGGGFDPNQPFEVVPAEKPQIQGTPRIAAGEVAWQLASGAVAAPVAGIAGLGTMAARGLGMTNADPADVVRGVQGAMTYQPRTVKGQRAAEVIGYPFQKLAEGADFAGRTTADVRRMPIMGKTVGGPAGGSFVNTAIQSLPGVLLSGKISKPRGQGRPSASPEAAARGWVGSNTSLDWARLPDSFRAQLTEIAADSKNLSRLNPAAIERQARLAELNVPATRGQITRDPVALRNEGNVSATNAGKPIRDVYEAQNKALIDNLEGLRPKVGERPATPEAAGQKIQGAARAKLKLQEQKVKALYDEADTAGETAVKVDVDPILDVIRASPDKTHYGWAESWIKSVTAKDKAGAGVPLRPRNMKSPAPGEDSALQFLAKTKRGIDIDEAVAQGLDPADFRLPAARVGGNRAFRKGGMSFDEVAEMLDEAGYPVRDMRGGYSANAVLDVLDGELRGRPSYSTQNTRLIAEAETLRGEVQKLAEKARQADPDRVEALLESSMDDGMLAMELRRVIGKSGPPVKLSIRELEDLRKAAVARAKDGGTAGHYAGQLIKAIDDATDGAGGNLYKQARAARKAQAMEFDEQTGVSRLVSDKTRIDPSVPVEQTWRKTVIGGTIDDLRRVKKSLLTGGDAKTRTAGKDAWRAIQQQTVDHIVTKATRSTANLSDGTPNLTPAALKQAIDEIGPAKIEQIFGPGANADLRKIMAAAQDVKTQPPAGFVGSPTFANMLAFGERWVGKVPILGDVTVGAIKGGAKLREMGRAGREVRSALNSPLDEQALASRNALYKYQSRRNALAAGAVTVQETARR
jgi:hypothetical protein